MSKSLDGVITKKANQTETYTNEQIEDLMKCMDPQDGYLYFSKNFAFIQHPVKGKLQFDPYDYQVRLFNTYHNHRFNINMLPRQTGKTTCAAIYLTWFAMFNPDQTILIAAHKYTGAQEIMQRVRYVYECCPDYIRAGVTSYNKGSIEFENGSRIVSATTTDNTGRGMSISLLYCDEFAFVAPNIAEEFWTSISPTLATGGRAIITSTPNSDEDTFATIWKQAEQKFDDHGNEQELGINGFHSFTVHWDEHPDRDEEWREAEMGRIGEERFRREYGCEFLVYDETLINSITLANMQSKNVLVNMGQTRWYEKIKPDATYVVGLDPSMGTGGDFAAIQIIELPTYRQIGEWRHNTTAIPGQIRVLKDICDYIAKSLNNPTGIYWSVENNAIGEAALLVINDFGEENIPGLFLSEPMRKGHVRKFRKGFNTTHSSKLTACSKLKVMIENDKLHINSAALISELKNFVAVGTTYRGKLEESDDLVSALLLCLRIISVLRDWDPRIYNSFKSMDEEEDYQAPMPIFVSTNY